MSWLISEAMISRYASSRCSPGQVAGSSAERCSGGEPFAQSNGKSIQRAYLWRGRTTGSWTRFPSGMTCEPLTDSDGEAVLMSFLEDSPARTSAQPEKEPESKASDPACGWKWPASSVKYDPSSYSWKTRQCSLLGGLVEFSETWPRWGSMRNGECWERPTLAPRTAGSGSGLWPTPNAFDGTNSDAMQDPMHWARRRDEKQAQGIDLQFHLRVAVQMWPTPTASNASQRRQSQKWGGSDLVSTVTAEEGSRGHAQPRAGGRLNPTWVEWLMGWPLGWTDLGPSATDKYRSVQQRHGGFLPAGSEPDDCPELRRRDHGMRGGG